MTVATLRAVHPSRHGAPIIDRVDTAIFARRYFARCMACTYCNDWCCQHGVDVDEENVARIVALAADLEAFTGVARDRWFFDTVSPDREFPGGGGRRTRVAGGACVFLAGSRLRRPSSSGSLRGCLLHAFAIQRGIDYHDLKPMVSTLFPITFADGALRVSEEVADESLVCLGDGPTLYRGARAELGFYFGQALLTELDALEAERPTHATAPGASRRRNLPTIG